MRKIVSLSVAVLLLGLALTACTTADPTATPTAAPTAVFTIQPTPAPTPTPIIEYSEFIPSVEVPALVSDYVPAEDAVMFYVDADNGSDEGDGSASAPWQTLEHARDAVRTLIPAMSSDIVLNLTGEFFLEDTFALTQADGGANGFDVVYRSADGANALLSGGTRISGWTLYDAEKNIWSASVPAGTESRNFFVNGVRADRAATINGRPLRQATVGHLQTVGAFAVPGLQKYDTYSFSTTDTSYLSFAHPEDLELVFLWNWNNPHMPVESVVDLGNGRVTFTIPELAYSILIGQRSHAYGDNYTMYDSIYRIENAYELLDVEGEYYLDTHTDTLYYKPRTGDDMATADAVLGRLETIVSAYGERKNPIEHIRFDNLTFSYSEWNPVDEEAGYIDIQASFYKGDGKTQSTTVGIHPTAAIDFTYAHYFSIANCTVSHMGNVGISFGSSSQHDLVAGNEVFDCASSGIFFGGFTETDYRTAKSQLDSMMSTDNYIIDNYIHNIGVQFLDSVGINRGYAYNTIIAYNTITDNPYTAISTGWGWGHGGIDMEGSSTMFPYGVFPGDAIVCNYIKSSPNLLADGGCIYTLGRQEGMIVEGNYLNGSTEQGIYLDGLSNGIIVRYNVLENVARNFVIRGQENHVYENYTCKTILQNGIQPELGGQVYVDLTKCSESTRLSVMHSCGSRATFAVSVHPTFE